jgi:hypothetical protein
MSVDRRCSHCREIGHDIRGCQSYIDFLDERLIHDFTQNGNNAVFPLFNRNILRKLGDKYGLSRELNNNVYLERLILIYSHLGEQRRIERRNRRIAENEIRLQEERENRRQREMPTFHIRDNSIEPIAQVVVPFPISANQHRFRNILSIQDLNALRDSFVQLTFEIENEIIVRYEDTAPKIIVDISKFNEENKECECPICYETTPSTITNCDHYYCYGCISTMIDVRNEFVYCALCREKVNTLYIQSAEY